MSTVSFADSFLDNITLSEASIQAVVSTLTMERMTINNLRNPIKTDFILVFLESTLIITTLNYTNSDSILFRVRTSSVVISGIEFNNIINAVELGEIASSYNVSLSAITSTNTQITGPFLFLISSSVNISMTDIHILNSKTIVMKIDSSVFDIIDRLEVKNCSEGIVIKSSEVKEFRNSTFDQNGGGAIFYGGALKIRNSNITFINTSFTQNTAQSGGAIYFTCSSIPN